MEQYFFAENKYDYLENPEGAVVKRLLKAESSKLEDGPVIKESYCGQSLSMIIKY